MTLLIMTTKLENITRITGNIFTYITIQFTTIFPIEI